MIMKRATSLLLALLLCVSLLASGFAVHSAAVELPSGFGVEETVPETTAPGENVAQPQGELPNPPGDTK